MPDQPPTFHSSAHAAVAELRERFPETPFLALGQTALWDEPTKASFRRILDALWPEARLIAAAHDTDYFAKLPGHPALHSDAKYALVPHDDATTRDLWSAAGEMSRLFGSEDVPSRALLEKKAGVSMYRALRFADDPMALLSELTAAWGWSAIIHAERERKTARDIPLRDILPALLEQIEWAMRGSTQCIEGERAADAVVTAGTVRGWVYTFAEIHPDASLTDLYRDLFPRFYEMLLGGPPANLATSSTMRLLRFNRETASRPRFAIVDRFLNPITRHAAIDSYNLAVAHSDIYTLDRFAEGALPFDLVIPGQGRGTLCVLDDGTVCVDTPRRVTLCANCNLSSIERLAELVEEELGPDVALVGKAVTLLPMLAAEHILVFHEGASSYSPRTRRMLERFAEKRVPLPPLRPILRLRYAAWDALSVLGGEDGSPAAAPSETAPPLSSAAPGAAVTFRLPEHLAQAFGRETIPAEEFAACWRCAVGREEKRLTELSELRTPRALLSYLSQNYQDGWAVRAAEYETARMHLLSVWDRAQAIQGRVYTLYDQIRALKTDAVALEREKGNDFRARIQPLRERIAATDDPDEAATLRQQITAFQEERRQRFDAEIESRRSQVRFALATVRELKVKRLALERGEEATQARETLRRIESEAEQMKARIARNSLQAILGLSHTNYRPSSWWFPLVDPSGSWFSRLTATAELYQEPLSGMRDEG